MATTIDTSSGYISAYNVNSINSINKLASGAAIDKAADDPAGLTVADGLQIHERALSQSIANSTSGIALSDIAQDGIGHQKDILMEVKQLTLQASNGTMNNDEKEVIANQIDKLLQGYESIADSTNYNGESLLKTTGDVTDDLSIVGEDEIVSISKADTTSISDNLRGFLVDFTTDPIARENMIDAIDQGIDQLASSASDFGSSSNALESMIKNQLTQATNTANARSTVVDIDYSKEVSDFNKTNLLTQIGFLMQTQANAHTQRTVEILR